jgi:hypothetical protein
MVVGDNYSDEVEKRAMQAIQRQVGAQMKVNLKIVPEIPTNPNSGKFQEVISKIDPADIPSKGIATF